MTNGRGCDIILNSLADDKLKCSIHCLAQHGRFLEIGKYDLAKNTGLGMEVLLKNVAIHGILLDSLFDGNGNDWEEVATCLLKGLKSGVVQPLKMTVFDKYKVEDAFRFMAQGKHIGKVVLQVSVNCNFTVCASFCKALQTFLDILFLSMILTNLY